MRFDCYILFEGVEGKAPLETSQIFFANSTVEGAFQNDSYVGLLGDHPHLELIWSSVVGGDQRERDRAKALKAQYVNNPSNVVPRCFEDQHLRWLGEGGFIGFYYG